VLDAAAQHHNSSEQRGNNFRDGDAAVFDDSIIHDHRALQ
jgi:hypothetical protein